MRRRRRPVRVRRWARDQVAESAAEAVVQVVVEGVVRVVALPLRVAGRALANAVDALL